MAVSKKAKSFKDKLLDNKADKQYTKPTRETLIRNMFPGIKIIDDDYRFIDLYLKGLSPSEVENLVNIIMTYYWNAASRLMAQKKHGDTIKLEGLIDFCETIMTLYNQLLDDNQED